jgi:aldehyde dehydrogenase (NAD+)/betaine-aldehyde dehydrogenase
VRWTEELLIDGRPVRGSGEPLPVYDPATEQILASPPMATLDQLGEAVAAARRTFDAGAWAADREARAQVLERLAAMIEERGEELSAAIVREVGTPISTARGLQVARTAPVFRWFAEAARRDRDEDLGLDPGGTSASRVQYLPTGVVAAITAYNYPLLLACFKLGAAIAAGCTVVLLPSPQGPLTVLMLGRMLEEAGCPPGAVNTIVGEADVAHALTTHPDVDKVTFTGSVAIGAKVMEGAAASVKGVVLELGGKSAALLLPSADLTRVAPPVNLRYLRNAGQGCQCPTRILVPRDGVDEFVAASRAVFGEVVVGDPQDERTVVGPVISAAHRERVEGYVAEAVADGGEVVAGGGPRPEGPGWYTNPTLLTGVDNRHRICREEIFGPVAVLLPYDEVEEAIAIANDSDYGLAASIHGDRAEAIGLAGRLRAGGVTINGGGGTQPEAPMGGFKRSGVGREVGELGVLEFLEPQHVQWSTRH